MMTSIGLPVGFGTILGQLMSDSGAADIIADKLVSAFPEKRSIWGLSLAGFVRPSLCSLMLPSSF